MHLCRTNLKYSAHVALEEEYSCNYALLTSLGTNTIVHNLLNTRWI